MIEALVLAGSPEDCLAELRRFKGPRVAGIGLDLRLQLADDEEKLGLLAPEVGPDMGTGCAGGPQ